MTQYQDWIQIAKSMAADALQAEAVLVESEDVDVLIDTGTEAVLVESEDVDVLIDTGTEAVLVESEGEPYHRELHDPYYLMARYGTGNETRYLTGTTPDSDPDLKAIDKLLTETPLTVTPPATLAAEIHERIREESERNTMTEAEKDEQEYRANMDRVKAEIRDVLARSDALLAKYEAEDREREREQKRVEIDAWTREQSVTHLQDVLHNLPHEKMQALNRMNDTRFEELCIFEDAIRDHLDSKRHPAFKVFPHDYSCFERCEVTRHP